MWYDKLFKLFSLKSVPESSPKPPPMVVVSGLAHSATGRRDENQDNYLIIQNYDERETPLATFLRDESIIYHPLPSWDRNYLRMAVVDGMGGHKEGRQITEALVRILTDVPPLTEVTEMRDAVLEAHKQLQEQFPFEGKLSPGCTLVMVDLHRKTGDGILLNLGDSRSYRITPEDCIGLTHDHLSLEFALRDKEISLERYREILGRGERDSSLTQAIGFGSFGIIKNKHGRKPNHYSAELRLDVAENLPLELQDHEDVFAFQLAPNELLMLGSDGLWSHNEQQVWLCGEISKNRVTEDDVHGVVQAALDEGSRDNITILFCGVLVHANKPEEEEDSMPMPVSRGVTLSMQEMTGTREI
jgi:PPM family protein phosphatase